MARPSSLLSTRPSPNVQCLRLPVTVLSLQDPKSNCNIMLITPYQFQHNHSATENSTSIISLPLSSSAKPHKFVTSSKSSFYLFDLQTYTTVQVEQIATLWFTVSDWLALNEISNQLFQNPKSSFVQKNIKQT